MSLGLWDKTASGLVHIIIKKNDAIISSHSSHLQCYCITMLTVQWKTDMDRLDDLEATNPWLANEEMKQPIPWETPVFVYIGVLRNHPLFPLTSLKCSKIKSKKIRLKYHWIKPEICIVRSSNAFYNITTHQSTMGIIHAYAKNVRVNPVPKSSMAYLPRINMKAADLTTVLKSITGGFEVTWASNQNVLVPARIFDKHWVSSGWEALLRRLRRQHWKFHDRQWPQRDAINCIMFSWEDVTGQEIPTEYQSTEVIDRRVALPSPWDSWLSHTWYGWNGCCAWQTLFSEPHYKDVG